MSILLIIIHVIVCISLIVIVLLQAGKGAGMGAAFGGGSSQTLFGSSGAGTFLGKATTAVAIIFMLTSLSLAYVSSHRERSSLMTEPARVEEAQKAQTPDAEKPVDAAPQAPAEQPAQ
ncbi:MAG: preprotein translocase subunit SecG [Proteobacteria bacterium]|nr:preprotein translocase subunit SecG [Pseudomonadota bacterium]MBU4318293.1 preprotein translocase subunit SecG [Pseudomonadota bacterium]MBU4469896.1 preprotein translocase subunit SecG [Pseudomonadota bacterium]MCG2751582.1 preprotein translocase subunit SecG [Desulfobacteraceae bacterium]